jgi:hypothetical protein
MFRASRSTYCCGRILPRQTGGELASDGRRVQVYEPSDNHDAAEERKAARVHTGAHPTRTGGFLVHYQFMAL